MPQREWHVVFAVSPVSFPYAHDMHTWGDIKLCPQTGNTHYAFLGTCKASLVSSEQSVLSIPIRSIDMIVLKVT